MAESTTATTIVDQTPKEKPVVLTSSGNKKPIFKFSFANPKILATLTVFLLLIGGIGTGVYLTQKPPQTTTEATTPQSVQLIFRPEVVDANVASQFRVDVFANAGESKITSVDLTFDYDASALTLISIVPGQFLPKILIPPQINSGTATISLGTDGNDGVSGSGIIAGLVFEAIKPSATTIAFNPGKTTINVLNRSPENAHDTLGGAQVNITSSSSSIKNDQSASPSALPAELSGTSSTSNDKASDFNDDGFINSIDLSLLYSGWGNPKTDVQKKADLNQDGVINGVDYSFFLPKFQL